MAKKDQDSQLQDEGEGSRVVELKVSSNGRETWFRRKINRGVDLEESGLLKYFVWEVVRIEFLSQEETL